MDANKKFMTIRQVAAAGYDTGFHLRLLLRQGKLPGFFSGRTFKVNVPLLIELLDRESLENASGGSHAEEGGD